MKSFKTFEHCAELLDLVFTFIKVCYPIKCSVAFINAN